jgi:hypothetical protein
MLVAQGAVLYYSLYTLVRRYPSRMLVAQGAVLYYSLYILVRR